MFETHDHALLAPDLFIAPQAGSHRWAYVAQTWSHEWFFVTLESTDEDDNKHCQQLMIPRAHYLLGLASRDTSETRIQQIQLVSPPWLNESGSWLMEPLREIRLIGRVFCYLLENGNCYPVGMDDSSGKVVWPRESGTDE